MLTDVCDDSSYSIIYSTAETMFKRSLKMRQQLLPTDHPDIGQSYKNLAALYYDQKELEKAEPLDDKALQIKLKVSSDIEVGRIIHCMYQELTHVCLKIALIANK